MYRKFFKRVLDIFCAVGLLFLLSPLLILVCVLVRIKHGSPIIFKQRRVGKDQKIFWFYKFRSMSNAKDENGELLPDTMRLTKFGKFIRKTSIDELPQLFNILKGNMSFIGPRPKDVKECVFFNEEQCGRFRVLPGISGLAQVSGRNSITFEKIAELDNKYADRVTFWGDVKIAFKTIAVIFKKESIDSNVQDTNHLCYYYNDLLLQRGDITRDEYDTLVGYSLQLKAGVVMRDGLEQIRRDTAVSSSHE